MINRHSQMKNLTLEVYNRIDNKIYNTKQAGWWETDSPFHLIKLLLNPVRINYIQKKLTEQFPLGLTGKIALEVGCGGGILCEDIAKMGVDVTGIDPSEPSITCATKHAKQNDLSIKYRVAGGENIPFKDECFDIALSCDALEHVRDLPQVISEISRVMKPGGILIYDTINRTLLSYIVAIKILQRWKRWALLPANLHVWEMFIRPRELKALFLQNNLEMKENKGIVPDISPMKIVTLLHQRVSGKLSYEEFGSKFRLIEGRFLNVSYMGYAIKMII
jgi:2-polyprenyl-6-hydroxyphenyl methylase/3-demethylubiquinone-9 3-methyltransferase